MLKDGEKDQRREWKEVSRCSEAEGGNRWGASGLCPRCRLKPREPHEKVEGITEDQKTYPYRNLASNADAEIRPLRRTSYASTYPALLIRRVSGAS